MVYYLFIINMKDTYINVLHQMSMLLFKWFSPIQHRWTTRLHRGHLQHIPAKSIKECVRFYNAVLNIMSEISRILFYFIDDNVNETRLSVFSFVCRGVTTNNTCSDGFILYTVYITCIMKIIVISHNRQVKYIVLSIKSLNTWSPLSINFM